MTWLLVAAGGMVLTLIGLCIFRAGSRSIFRIYVLITIVLFVIYFMNFALVLGVEYLPWPKYLLLAFLPATAVLMVLSVKRDRDEVMGAAADREAMTTAAVVYGAGSYAEMTDVGGGMESQ